MATGFDWLASEQLALVALIEGVALRSERHAATAANVAAIGRDQPKIDRLTEMDYATDIAKEEGGRNIHRRFQLLPRRVERWGSTGGVFSGPTQDKMVVWELKIGYEPKGGGANPFDLKMAHLACLDDAELVSQVLEHPTNLNTRTVLIDWRGTDILLQTERKKLISVSRYHAQMRPNTEEP